MERHQTAGPEVHLDLLSVLPEEDWKLYRPILIELHERNLRFALAGGLVASLYGGHGRFTKDLDLFILPDDRDAIVEVAKQYGFGDLYERAPYRRDWIYRGVYGDSDIILDIIWGMANWRAQVDEVWFERSAVIEVDGVKVPLVSREELIWAKFFVMHRDRCDWPDVLNTLNLQAATLDWEHLLERIGPDWRLFSGLMCVFRWLGPSAAETVPEWVWQRLSLDAIRESDPGPGGPQRANLVDTYHDWFGPNNCQRPNPSEPRP